MSDAATDPVCGMTVTVPGLTVEHGGAVFQFCSAFCRDAFLSSPDVHAGTFARAGLPASGHERRIAYFSMEVALDPRMPTYSGGLGVLAGDTLRSCADLRVPVIGVSLLWRKGYFRQVLDADGRQAEAPEEWDPAQLAEPLSPLVEVEVEGRIVRIRPWRRAVVGADGYVVPVILLDTDVAENAGPDRALTDQLYGGDERHRLAQEIVLGIGGVRALKALGYGRLLKFHMNEGHASLLVLELLRDKAAAKPDAAAFESVRSRCVFTTHTPVPAGHDRFEYGLVDRVLGAPVPPEVLRMLAGDDRLNMTLLALNMSRYVNGVARRHEEVSRDMFPGYPIHHITNGVHSVTWTCDAFAALYDRHVPGWRNDPAMLRRAVAIPGAELWEAHTAAKAALLRAIRERTGRTLSPDALTIGFARRATPYKRADLVLADLSRLARIAERLGPVQLVFAGKAHPRDEGGKEAIRRITTRARELGPGVAAVYLENYDFGLARLLVSGTDLWLNTPQPPLEASGTSGMKAAHNGVPSLSTLDGWWPEGHVEGVTGWSIGGREPARTAHEGAERDSDDLYRKLEDEIVPRYYGDRDRWIELMRQVVAFGASHFNTHRMVQQYVTNAYLA